MPTATSLEVVRKCLAGMGVPADAAPDSLKDAPYLMNLEWRGTHATEELERILELLGYVFTVKQDGSFRIFKIGDSEGAEVPPEQGDGVVGYSMPLIDRRGKVVIFTSAPTAVTNTGWLSDLENGGLQWVCPDVDGKWKPLASHSLLAGKDPARLFRTDFRDIDEKYRDLVAVHLYRCFRTDPAVGRLVFYRVALDDDGAGGLIPVEARTVVREKDGLYVDSRDFIRVEPQALFEDGTILMTRGPLFSLGGKVSIDPLYDMVPLAPDQLRIRVTTDAVEEVGDEKGQIEKRPVYFTCGFRMELGGKITKLPAGEVEAIIDSKKVDRDAMIVPVPDLRLRRIDDEEVNRAELEARCEKLAPRYLRDSGKAAKVTIMAGFRNAALNGIVSEIEYSQDRGLTTVTQMSWWRPGGRYMIDPHAYGYEAAEKTGKSRYPNERGESSRRSSLGAPGTTQPAVILSPSAELPQFTCGMLFAVDLAADGGDQGSKDAAPTFTYTVRTLNGTKLLEKDSPPTMRPNGAFAAATRGLAYFDRERTAKLAYAHEIPATDSCPEAA